MHIIEKWSSLSSSIIKKNHYSQIEHIYLILVMMMMMISCCKPFFYSKMSQFSMKKLRPVSCPASSVRTRASTYGYSKPGHLKVQHLFLLSMNQFTVLT